MEEARFVRDGSQSNVILPDEDEVAFQVQGKQAILGYFQVLDQGGGKQYGTLKCLDSKLVTFEHEERQDEFSNSPSPILVLTRLHEEASAEAGVAGRAGQAGEQFSMDTHGLT